MTFSEIVTVAKQDQKFRRRSWSVKDFCLYIDGDRILATRDVNSRNNIKFNVTLAKNHGDTHLNPSDICANDWEFYVEQPKPPETVEVNGFKYRLVEC